MTTRHALLIGGGIAGPSLALFLRRAGVAATIYEAYPPSVGVGGGFGLAPNGLRVLDELRLAQRVEEQGSIIRAFCFRNERGRVLGGYASHSLERFGEPTVGILRAPLSRILLEEVNTQGIPIHYEKRLAAIDQDADGVTAHFADGTQARGDFLVGADGIRSAVRKAILFDGPGPSFVGLIGVGGFLPERAVPSVSEAEKSAMTFTFGPDGFFGHCGAGNGQLMWWSNLPRREELTRSEMANASLDQVKAEMLARYGGYHEPIPSLIRASAAAVKLNISDVPSLPTWSRGRVVLIGDAAHAVSPNAGQGASMALEDAMYLAMLLRESDDYPRVFARFERDRKLRVERVVAEGRRRGGDKLIVSPLQSKIREVMMSVMLRLVGERGDDWLYRYRIDWEAGTASDSVARSTVVRPAA